MPDKRDDDDTDSLWPWKPHAVTPPVSAPVARPAEAPAWRPAPSGQPERSAPPLPPTPAPSAVVPRDKPARERPSLGQSHGRQRALDAGLLLLAVVVIVLAVLALQG